MTAPLERELDFLLELQALTEKYGIAISGCGCCDSPSLEVAKQGGSYYYTGDIGSGVGEIQWRTPDEYRSSRCLKVGDGR